MPTKKRTGSLAELSDALSKKGFIYQYKAGQKSYSETGEAEYRDPSGAKALLRRIARGKPAQWTGKKVGLIRTAGTPDVWELVNPQKKSREIPFSKLLGRKLTKEDERHIATKIFISPKKKRRR